MTFGSNALQSIDYVVLISRWVHIGSAIVAIGGAVFMRFALLPAASSTLDEDAHERLREAIRARWARFVHISIVLLLVTGGLNFGLLAIPPKIQAIPYHPIFGLKLVSALFLFFVASALVGRGEGTAEIRADRRKWLSILLAMAAGIILLSGVLNQIRTHQKPKVSPEPTEQQAATE